MYTASIGRATQSAVCSFLLSEIAFGTSSPNTTWRYVTKAKERMNATPVESRGSSSQCSTIGSPTAPRAIENAVIPSCTVPMKRAGLSMIRRAMLARRLPVSANSFRRARRAVTSAYSAATKNAFPATIRRTAMSWRRITPRSPGRGGLLEAEAMVLDDLPGPRHGVADRFAVTRQRQPRRELDRAAQGGQVVAERVRARLRIKADGRSDLAQEMVACDQDPVAEEADVPVGVAGQLEHAPAVDLVALVHLVGVSGEADER